MGDEIILGPKGFDVPEIEHVTELPEKNEQIKEDIEKLKEENKELKEVVSIIIGGSDDA